MSHIFKQVLLYYGKMPHVPRVRRLVFRTLPVKWPAKEKKKPTSSMARDNVHRFLKDFKILLPYGMKISTDECDWQFRPPKGWTVSFGLIFDRQGYLRTSSSSHYATARQMIQTQIKKNGSMKLGRKP